MKLAACVACGLPVLELSGQFECLDSYYVEADGPPLNTVGDRHTKGLRESGVGGFWQPAFIRNFCQVRGYVVHESVAGWTVLKNPRTEELVAFSSTGESLDLNLEPDAATTPTTAGVVVHRRERTFHLHIDDAAFAAEAQQSLRTTGSFSLARVLDHLGTSEKMAEPAALANGRFVFDDDLQTFWVSRGISAQLEYGVLVPGALVHYVVQR